MVKISTTAKILYLQRRENSEIQIVLNVVRYGIFTGSYIPETTPEEDDAGARAPQSLVGSSRHHVTVGERRCDYSSCDESCRWRAVGVSQRTTYKIVCPDPAHRMVKMRHILCAIFYGLTWLFGRSPTGYKPATNRL